MKKTKCILILLSFSIVFICGCLQNKKSNTVKTELFGNTANKEKVYQLTLENKNGMKVQVLTYGAIIRCIQVSDRNGKFADVVLGYDSISQYEKDKVYFGPIVGRYANRIRNSKFKLDGIEYNLTKNENNKTHLHGGAKGFGKVLWQYKIIQSKEGNAVKLTYLSKDGEEGYPGNFTVEVTYTLTNNNELKIDYSATCDMKTVCNLSSHGYYNLAGVGKSNILSQELIINADKYTENDIDMVPTGKIINVEGTPLDFRKYKKIGKDLPKISDGMNFNFIVNKKNIGEMTLALAFKDSASGRVMELYTTEPAIQTYSGIILGKIKGKGGITYPKFGGLVIEPQHFPDSPNHPEFPTTILEPGKKYIQHSILKFSVQ